MLFADHYNLLHNYRYNNVCERHALFSVIYWKQGTNDLNESGVVWHSVSNAVCISCAWQEMLSKPTAVIVVACYR